MNNLTDLISAATSFIEFAVSTLGTLAQQWFVFIPMVIMVAAKGISTAKGLLFYRKHRRG